MKSDDQILEEFNRFKEEYCKDPVFAVYQMHKSIEVLMSIVSSIKEPNEETKQTFSDTDAGINLNRTTVDTLEKDLGL